MTLGSRPTSESRASLCSTSSRLAATRSTVIWRPSASGSRIWKSSSTLSMSNGTCCSASQRITSRASVSCIRSMVIFLTITSRPPTATTTCLVFTPAVAMHSLIASATIPGSMISPSTMASLPIEVNATLVRTGPPDACETATSLIRPLPMSRPTVVALRPKSPIRVRGLRRRQQIFGGQRATDVPHKLQFGNRLRDDHLTGEKSLRCRGLSGALLLFRKLSLGMQQWRQSVEQHCKFWQLVQLDPRSLANRQQNLGRGGGIRHQVSQQSHHARGQLSSSSIQPGGPALYKEEIIGQSNYLPLQPEPGAGRAWSEIQGRASNRQGKQARSRDLRHNLPQLSL